MELTIDRSAAVKKSRALVLSARGNTELFREKLERTFACEELPNHVECTGEEIGGVRCDVLSPEVFSSDKITIYVHGGSFVGGSGGAYRGFCSSLAHAMCSKILIPDFRLAPAHPYPASADDVGTVLAFYGAKGAAPSSPFGNEAAAPAPRESRADAAESAPTPVREIILCADGSGAVIALSCVFKIPPEQRSLISKIILFSPWLDLASDSFPKKHMRDEVLSCDDIFHAADLYTYSSNLKNIFISPLRASGEDFKDFPEVYIQIGGKELLLFQAEKFCENLKSAGVKVTLDVVPSMMFMFQMADEYLEEPQLAIERIGQFVNRKPELSARDRVEAERLIKENHIISD